MIWERKNYLVYVGASLIGLSLGIMYGLIAHTSFMSAFLNIETWYVISVLLAPIGYVVQDVVADAMTVEAVPNLDDNGNAYSLERVKNMHTTMQTLGRFAIIGGTVVVALINVIIFSSVEAETEQEKILLYANIYLFALIIPLISVLGVFLSIYLKNKRRNKLFYAGVEEQTKTEKTNVDWWILGGSLIFVTFTLTVGGFNIPYAQEIVFVGSVSIIFFLMAKLMRELPESMRLTILGTAIIIFIFRAMPGPGAGLTWFEIDNLGFDEQFFSVLSLLASFLTLLGIIVLRPFMVNNSIAKIIVILSIAGAVLFLPSVGR